MAILTTMIGNMRTEQLTAFMRFVTGSGVCTVKSINVTSNSLSGLAFRLIAQTCDPLLELPGAYELPKAAKERVTTVPSKYKLIT